MKALVTGTSREQANALTRRPIDRANISAGVTQAFRNANWDVEHRPIWSGEDLRQFDFLWITVGAINGVAAAYAPGMLYGIHHAVEHDIPFALLFEDWQFTGMLSAFRRVHSKGESEFRKLLEVLHYYKEPAEKVLPHMDKMLEACGWFLEADSPVYKRGVPTLPLYSGVARPDIVSKRFPGEPEFWHVDPTPILRDSVKDVPATPKDRRWSLVTLVDHMHWVERQKLTWPVDVFGPRKLKSPRLKSEREVVLEYAKRWGVLAPRYSISAGSGWWRARYYLAANACAVIFCGKEDAAELGPIFEYSPDYIEALPDSELYDLAMAQTRITILATNDSWSHFQSQLAQIADEAKRR